MVAPISSAQSITAFDAKNRLGRLLDRVQAGEELVITRHGRAVARLVPVADGAIDDARRALSAFSQVRLSLASKGVTATRREIRAWRAEGRR